VLSARSALRLLSAKPIPMSNGQPPPPQPPFGAFGKAVALMEHELAITPGFLVGLVNEDDWSFVIKVSALIEATVTHLVVARLATPEIADTFSRLSMNGRSGKQAFARALGLLSKHEVRFIEEISSVRNTFAHDPRSASTSLDAYLRDLAPERRSAFISSVGRLLTGEKLAESITIDGTPVRVLDMVTAVPKVMIWMAAMLFITAKSIKYVYKDALEAAAIALRDAPDDPPS
jgi:hypothetical protein